MGVSDFEQNGIGISINNNNVKLKILVPGSLFVEVTGIGGGIIDPLTPIAKFKHNGIGISNK